MSRRKLSASYNRKRGPTPNSAAPRTIALGPRSPAPGRGGAGPPGRRASPSSTPAPSPPHASRDSATPASHPVPAGSCAISAREEAPKRPKHWRCGAGPGHTCSEATRGGRRSLTPRETAACLLPIFSSFKIFSFFGFYSFQWEVYIILVFVHVSNGHNDFLEELKIVRCNHIHKDLPQLMMGLYLNKSIIS